MITSDALVVGGGPAGSTAARALRRLGLDVVVIDRASFPRDKVCAGWITPAVVEALELDLRDYARDRVLQPIHALRIGLDGGAEVRTKRRSEPISYGIRRCEFDDYLLRRSGARLLTGRPVRQLAREAGWWRVDDDARAPLIVGAGGHFCPVARHLGARPGRSEAAVLAQEVEFRVAEDAGDVEPEVPRLLFRADLSGYGWIFRKGDWLNVGLGRESPRDLADDIAEFRRHLVESGAIPASTPTRFHGHAYLLYPRAPRRIVADGALLVGDAAGLAYPESGEGIRPAVESALLAARTVAEAGGEHSEARLARYREAIEARFGPRGGRRSAGSLIPPALRRGLARGLLAHEWFARRVVQDRWFLHAHQSALEMSPPPVPAT